MRRLFTMAEARGGGLTNRALCWGETKGKWRRIIRGVYGVGPEHASDLDIARARILLRGAIAAGRLAGVLHQLDGVLLDGPPKRRRRETPGTIVRIGGINCTGGLQTMIDLAAEVDDLVWEQALEAALRRKLTTIAALEAPLPSLGRART